MFRFLLRRRSSPHAGLVALSAFGGAVALSTSDGPSRSTTSQVMISISSPLRHLLSSASELRIGEFASPPLFSVPPTGGFAVPHFSVANALPTSKSADEASGERKDDVQCCKGCLSRNFISNAASAVGPAVVNISVMHGMHGRVFACRQGSGTIIDPDGTILTCAHILSDYRREGTVAKGKIAITLQDGREFDAIVVNADFDSDIAILKIKSDTALPTAKLGSSSKLRQGDWVIALGCPLSLTNSITAGIVSNVDRKFVNLDGQGDRREYLQTDCAINEGNSGGPLVNLDGEIVGINQLKVHAANSLSFAVPIDSVIKIVEQFRKNGRVVRPWLGVKMLELNEINITHLKERNASFPDVSKGVLVPMVTPGSPAERAGFRSGDVVIEFDGHPVGSIKEIIDIIEDKVGKPVRVTVKRQNNHLLNLIVVPEEANTL